MKTALLVLSIMSTSSVFSSSVKIEERARILSVQITGIFGCERENISVNAGAVYVRPTVQTTTTKKTYLVSIQTDNDGSSIESLIENSMSDSFNIITAEQILLSLGGEDQSKIKDLENQCAELKSRVE